MIFSECTKLSIGNNSKRTRRSYWWQWWCIAELSAACSYLHAQTGPALRMFHVFGRTGPPIFFFFLGGAPFWTLKILYKLIRQFERPWCLDYGADKYINDLEWNWVCFTNLYGIMVNSVSYEPVPLSVIRFTPDSAPQDPLAGQKRPRGEGEGKREKEKEERSRKRRVEEGSGGWIGCRRLANAGPADRIHTHMLYTWTYTK